MTKQSKKLLRLPIPGMTHANILLPVNLHETMKSIEEARYRTEGQDPTLSRIYREAVELYIQSIDLETGLPKLPSARRKTPVLLIPADLPVFSFDPWSDDATLFRLMDESQMMLWAAGNYNENQHANPALLEFAGRSTADFLNMGWAQLVHPTDRDEMLHNVAEAFRTHKPFRVSYRMRRKDGRYGLMLDIAHPRFRPDGSFAGYVGTMHEVVERAMGVEILGGEEPLWTPRQDSQAARPSQSDAGTDAIVFQTKHHTRVN
jgi:PAS domain S-box-containing protein